MNAELEALILAYDSFLESRDRDRKRAYDTLLEQTLEKHSGLSRESLNNIVVFAHRNWARRQESKPPHLPPRA